MLTDARTLSENAQLQCDICLIGAGAAGISLAAELEGSGLSVLLVEAGGEKPDADGQTFYHGELISQEHATPDMYRQRRLGGSTTIWGGRCIPFDPIDFEARDWVPLSGWPFDRAAIDPYYARAQVILDAGRFDYSASTALPPGALIEGLAQGDISTDTIERFSLPTDFWRSQRETLKASRNVHVLSNAACVALHPEGDAAIGRAELVTPEGRRLTVAAKDFVVAAGGIESYRILAASARERGGLGNHSDMLGRTYMCHVEMASGRIRIDPSNRAVSHGFEHTLDGVYARRRFTLSAERQRERKVMNVSARLHHASVVDPVHRDAILSLMYLAKHTVIPEYRRKLNMVEYDAAKGLEHDWRFWSSHIWNILYGSPRAAAFVTTWITKRILAKRKLPYVALHNAAGIYAVDMNGEQAPNRDSRITLSDQTDRHGMPRVQIDWRLTELDVETVLAAYADLEAALRGSGVGRLEDYPTTAEQVRPRAMPLGGHHIGTARMAEDPAQGVVDANCKVHAIANLHIAGAAVFPTSSHANPTLTLVALAIRLADRLKTLHGKPA